MRPLEHLAALLLLAVVVDTVSCRHHHAPAGAPHGVAPSQHLLPCLEELLPCTAYLKTTKHPSATCCTAMHNAAAAEMPCLCRLFADPELLATFNVTREQMFKLPARCGLPVGCRTGTSSHEPVVEAPPPPAPVQQHRHQHGASSRGDEFRSIWSLIASLVLGQMVPMAALF
ncbi:non-specific lipid transfer protein GPI-anchored 7-like [Miscanthus floridulus]|uniref:non-specific lipid transfer protein GPI-anchored 7-like n=1 Tax=Miscanthus floridulus TaxID=154761 RepID=UPI003459AD5D